ncbi:DExH-box ATP-dependent RNA helicase DExH7, chloroplastic [Chenopodium quinoa]|uniref:DExH-box ATP-dependent RNA helicase DExH7, chloroplastic n=1 Tax=Chenopodium quinoa TaxID=63459 RepID=UPI000B76CB95|nr:DExH-box ATP-dependent RNA helicase DExH7, chloroplastic [Chenopodium quinoa]XP_021743072.1 DExH-box ATP-dependent RNA helicase DExH7, chloroplastic [Chenopodium quinoa]
MAPKKKQQQQKQKQQQQKNNSSSSAGGPKLQLSAENEQRLRRLLLNNSSDAATVRPTFEESQSSSLSKAQKTKKLKSIYENLSGKGFSDDQIERALSSLKDGATFEVALDWLCLNLSRTELPVKFRDGLSMHSGGSIGVVSTAQENWNPPADTTTRSDDEVHKFSVITRGRCDDNSLALHEPSQADWIRQYMEKEEEIETENWEDMLSDEDSCKKEPRSYDTIIEEYQSARLEAFVAKEKKDKKSQEAASNKIRLLKQEIFDLGELNMFMSDIAKMEAPCSVYNKEGNSNIEAMADSLFDKVGMENCSRDEATVQNIPFNEVEPLQEESEDIELCNIFMEGDSSNAALTAEVVMKQNKARTRGLPTSKDLEKLEGIWKKGDPPRIPKAVLHQLCQRSGWDPPKFDKLGKKGSGFNYSVSVLRKSTGRGKSRKAGGLITLQLPGQDETFESAEEAQNRVAAFSLCRLFPDIPVRFLITEPYASLVVKWQEGDLSDVIEDSMEDRRAAFVESLLNADSSVGISSADVGDNSSQNKVSDMFDEQSAAASLQSNNPLKEKESFFLREELENKQKSPRYKSMLEARTALPIAKTKDEILRSLKQNNVVVVCGETGSGKTTQVPQYILDDMIVAGRGGHCNIVCTQPRRIAAISVAERVADERCEPAPGVNGSLVGYQVRLDSARNDQTKLLFCTTGILLRQIAGNKSFHGVTHVIVDEVHERSLLGDFLIIVLKNFLEKQAACGAPKHLKVILMSATVDSSLFSRYFGDCPVITAEGRTYPVSTFFLEDVYEKTDYHLPSDSPACLGFKTSGHEIVGGSIDNRRGKKSLVLSSMGDETLLSEECMNPHYNPSAYQSYSDQTRVNLKKLNEDVIDYDLLEDLVCHIDENCGEGAILVFLPGISEIYRLHDKLAASYRFGGESSEWLLPLHSSIAAADQKKVFRKPPNNMRKIIMATNIAETSLTIDDVVYVVDSGKHKEYRYDPRKKLSMMVEDWISQANAKQRRGRAGRVKPGTCFCLYTRHRFEKMMRSFQVPEMLRMPLVELCLQIKLLSLSDIKLFLSKAIEMPKDEAIDSAVSSLKEVGAVDENEELTPLGHHLAKLPVDLLLGKMMLYGAIFGCLSPILSIAAFLSHKSPFVHLKDEREFVERSKLAILSDKTDGSSSSYNNASQSDHIIMMIAYEKWEKILRDKGVKAAQNYCKRHSLSSSVMHTIRDMRVQLGTLLADIGLIHLPDDYQGRRKGNLDGWFSNASQPFNKHANHCAVVKAILCAGLYPNVAATVDGIHAPALGNLRQSLKSISKGSPAWYDGKREVHIHPSSVNGDSKIFQHPFLVFLEKVETHKVFLRDTTIISPYSLLLFGGSIQVQHQLGLVTVDGWLKVAAPAQTAVLFKELRSTLQSVLDGLIRNPQRATVENEVVQSIVHFLVEETKPQA